MMTIPRKLAIPDYVDVGIRPVGLAPAPARARGSFEADTRKIVATTDLDSDGQIDQTPVFQTADRWRAIDVYVIPQSDMPATAFGRVKIYGRAASGRFLVASGYFAHFGRPVDQRPVWVASARADATVFEVDYIPIEFGAASTSEIAFSYVASDTPVEVPSSVGIVPFSSTVRDVVSVVPQSGALASHPTFETEVVKLVAHNTNAAVRFIQVLDALDAAFAAGLAPLVSVGIPPGQSVVLGPEMLAGYRFGVNGCVIGGSTTAATFTAAAAGQVIFQAWIR